MAAALVQLREQAVSQETVRAALANVCKIYECLKPFERKELMRLVLRRAEVSAQQMTLEVYGFLNAALVNDDGEASFTGVLRSGPPDWLPGPVPQSVLRDVFTIQLLSLAARVQREVADRMRRGRAAVAAEWRSTLASGGVESRAELARRNGLTRARVTQVLGS